jgi:hypothetical protein
MADDEKQERLFVRRPVQHPVQETHRAGRVGKRRKPGVV